ncbi:MAG: hypothetical protein NTY50_09020 [Methylobacter sp.]|nr:hypothetical protein [Methylobacter sp.]
MAITSKWRQHIEAWQRSGLSQATANQCAYFHSATERLSQTA